MTPAERARKRELARNETMVALSLVQGSDPQVCQLCEAIERLANAVTALADVSESQESAK